LTIIGPTRAKAENQQIAGEGNRPGRGDLMDAEFVTVIINRDPVPLVRRGRQDFSAAVSPCTGSGYQQTVTYWKHQVTGEIGRGSSDYLRWLPRDARVVPKAQEVMWLRGQTARDAPHLSGWE